MGRDKQTDTKETYDFDGLAQRDAWATMRLDEYQQRGDLTARDEVYGAFSPLAKITVTRIAHPIQEREDVIQEARYSLLEAIEEWDPERGVRFSTWAIAKMRYACVEYARKTIWGTRGMQSKMREAQRRLTQIENGDPMTYEELMNGGLVLPPEFALMPMSLDSLLHMSANTGESDTLYLRDTITADINCEFAAMENILHDEVKSGVNDLPEREQLVFRLYYHEGMTFKQVGQQLGVSESRIFQLHQQGMTRLRLRIKGEQPEKAGAVAPYTIGEDRANRKKYRKTYRRGMAQIAA